MLDPPFAQARIQGDFERFALNADIAPAIDPVNALWIGNASLQHLCAALVRAKVWPPQTDLAPR
ncbi:hypothetical protein D3C78_1954280 [compost metagenome]